MPLTIVPNAGQNLRQTRDSIRDNFVNINSGFAEDHVEFNGGGNSGKHKAIHLVNQTNAPAAPVTGGGEVAIYSAPSLVAPFPPALYFKGQNSADSVDGINFTSSVKTSTPIDNSSGWALLPSGIIMKWGSSTVNPNSASAPVNFASGAGIPTFAFAPSITVSLNGVAGMDKALFVQAVSTTAVTVYNANANGGQRVWYYFAIGV